MTSWLAVMRPRLDRNQWRSGWPALRRAAADWDLRRENHRWDSALGAFRQGRWQVRPLTRGRELLDEGRRMRHCVGGYIPRCLRGEYRVFTVEDTNSGKPQVTIGLVRTDEGWRLDQVRGKRNREPDDEKPLAAAGTAAVASRCSREASTMASTEAGSTRVIRGLNFSMR